MPAFEVQLRAKIGNLIDEITGKYPSVRVLTWCNFIQDVHELVSDNVEELHAAIQDFKKVYNILNETEISSSVRLITQNCICSKATTVHDNIQELEILNIMPILCTKGYEYCRLIAFRHEALQELFNRLSENGFEIEVEEMAPFNGMVSDNLITLNSLVSNLTQKQMDAIIAAFNNGYYQTPREVNVEKIAERLKVPRTTLQEHLNKAENKLISQIVPQIKLYSVKTRNAD